MKFPNHGMHILSSLVNEMNNNNNNYYSKIRQCDFCKNLGLEISLVKDSVLGTICVLCAKSVDKHLNNVIVDKAMMAKEIETY